MPNKRKGNHKPFQKTPVNIVKSIFTALQDGHIHTLNDLAQRAKIHWVTLSRYLHLITYIQKQPQVRSFNAKAGERDQLLIHLP
ncbi:MAG: hypothetical protein ACTSVM_05160, partial [Candidatus Ranarchaeia archaeon]